MDHATAEAAFVQQVELQADMIGKRLRSATYKSGLIFRDS
jgi:hypothetical protein